jgi:hypothetical protein
MEKLGTDNRLLAIYVNDELDNGFGSRLKRPSELGQTTSHADYADYEKYARIDAGLEKQLSNPNLPANLQRDLSEVMKENRIQMQRVKDKMNQQAEEYKNLDIKSPHPKVAQILRTDKYPQYMNFDEREAWEKRIRELPDSEWNMIRPHLNALNMTKDWREGMKPAEWSEHWTKISNIRIPSRDANGNRRQG